MERDETIWATHYNHPARWESDFAPLSLPDMLAASAERDPLAPLVDFMGRKYSYAETLDGARRVASGLHDLGVERGDRIGLFLPNVPHYVAAYYGAMMLGATIVNFSPLYTVEELKHQVEDSGTKILFTLSAQALLPTALKVLDQSSLERLIIGSVAGALPGTKSLFYRLFRGKEVADRPHDDPRLSSFSALIDNQGEIVPVPIDAGSASIPVTRSASSSGGSGGGSPPSATFSKRTLPSRSVTRRMKRGTTRSPPRG